MAEQLRQQSEAGGQPPLGQQQALFSPVRMNTRVATLYDEWRQADGLFEPEAAAKIVAFKNGFVRVRQKNWDTVSDEGWATNIERAFAVPPWHYLEVLGSPQIKFSRA